MTIFTGELYPFQVEGVAFLTGRRRRLLADDVGLGKTVQIAAAIGQLWDVELSRDSGLRVLYVTAANLVGQTVAELQARLPSLTVVGSIGHRPLRPLSLGHLPDVLVTSHEFVHSQLTLVMSRAPRLVVVDEA